MFRNHSFRSRAAGTLAMLLSLAVAPSARAYHPITSTAGSTVVLTGHDLTLDQLMRIARDGAPVSLSPSARQRSQDAYDLLLEAAREGVPVYWFNRGAGDQREVSIFTGDPLAPANKALLEKIQLDRFRREGRSWSGAEVDDEALVRAVMAIRANTMSYEAASPPLTQMLQDLLNHRVTPVIPLRGSLGEGDLAVIAAIGATMVGEGNAYYHGERMKAIEALRRAGLRPLQPFAADDAALISSDAYAVARAAIAVEKARRALDWADLALAIDLQGMNSSITPLSSPVQAARPYTWLNRDAARVLGLLRGSYLMDNDPHRIIQDPESLRASSIRQGSAWQAWAALRDTVLLAMNSSDHNPATRVGVSPGDSWELSTPQMMRYYVRGSDADRHLHGYVLSNANWDPYPLANQVEAMTIALGNMDVAVTQRLYRFDNTLFTVVSPHDVLSPDQVLQHSGFRSDYTAADIFQDVQGQMNPVSPEGNAIIATVEDLQAQTYLKTVRLHDTVEDTIHLLALDLTTGCDWMTLRRIQNPKRGFGAASMALCRDLDGTMTDRVAFINVTNPARYLDHGI
ncbi:aromatic amino acid ammonia-lyase [Nguyenibacter vanlangensis]|uniref:Aromatic amino acid lyase n=1 Tax=Nguyenibacter vanlangensis TaxID=1216886 RepID=A0A7Y7IT58_9PROT|nr:aromatic amino acid ammonia-lyase [Nguyenibacter vanlangensis]NVN09889.1 aromatic amino acid lyase [Nguyenibacter vanlangensis]